MNNRTINQDCPFKDECNHIDCGTFCQKLYKCNYYFEGALVPKDKRLTYLIQKKQLKIL